MKTTQRDLAPKTWNPEALAEDIALKRVVRVFFAADMTPEKRLGFRADVLVGGYRQVTGPVCATEHEALLAVQPELLRRGCSKSWPIRVVDRLGDRIGGFGWSLSAYVDAELCGAVLPSCAA